MGIFSTTSVILACAGCGSAVGRARWRAFPGQLDVMDLDGAPARGERAGRVLQRLDEGTSQVEPDRLEALRGWLGASAVELVYRESCPHHGTVWLLAPDVARAIRSRAGQSTWVTVETH